MRVLTSETKLEPIDAVKPHPRNPRQGDIGAIHQSIQANGFYGAILAQKSTGHIIAGNHRWQAARQAKAKKIPVTWLDIDDDHALRILLADNRTNDLASYADEMLAEILQELHGNTGTLQGTGYDGDDLDEILTDLGHVSATDFPKLPDGAKEPFQQMTFTLHDSQVDVVQNALKTAKAMGQFDKSPNENSNGNALARICEIFMESHG
jgi:hypothetical protein